MKQDPQPNFSGHVGGGGGITPYQSMQMQKQSLQSLTLPDVTIGSSGGGAQRINSSIQLKEALSASRKEEMLIDDYNVRVNPAFKQQAFNKISFKKDTAATDNPQLKLIWGPLLKFEM